MIYGYNSKLSSHGIDTIMDYGRELIEEIKKIRIGIDVRTCFPRVAHKLAIVIL